MHWLTGGWVATKQVGNHGAAVRGCNTACASPEPTWLGGMVGSSQQTMLLYDVDGTLLQSQSAWQATDSFSLLPGQCGPLNCQYISRLPDILHFDSDPSPSSVDGTPLVTLDCLSDLRCIQEGVPGGCLLRSGMGSDPGGTQNWPFDPGLSQYTPMHSKILTVPNLPFSPIWGATDSLLLLPAQSGLTKFLHYPHLLNTHILHPGQGVWGDYFVQGKVGSGPGERRYTPFDPGSSYYKFGQVPSVWGASDSSWLVPAQDGWLQSHRGPQGCLHTPFDPGPWNHWDLVQKGAPLERLPQHEPHMNPAELFTLYMYYAQLCLPTVKSMTPSYCIASVVHRFRLRPLKSLVRPPGSILTKGQVSGAPVLLSISGISYVPGTGSGTEGVEEEHGRKNHAAREQHPRGDFWSEPSRRSTICDGCSLDPG